MNAAYCAYLVERSNNGVSCSAVDERTADALLLARRQMLLRSAWGRRSDSALPAVDPRQLLPQQWVALETGVLGLLAGRANEDRMGAGLLYAGAIKRPVSYHAGVSNVVDVA